LLGALISGQNCDLKRDEVTIKTGDDRRCKEDADAEESSQRTGEGTHAIVAFAAIGTAHYITITIKSMWK
jgi:hypothetical protein